jgi:hypothetical protein
MCLPAVVRLSRSFWVDARNGTDAEKLQFVMRQLPLITAWCRIRTLELPRCGMTGQDAERLAGVLAQSPALTNLDLSWNLLFGAGAEILVGVLAQCWTEGLAEVLGQCRELVHLNLSGNQIDAGGTEKLARGLAQCTALAHLDLSCKGQRGLQESWHSAQRWLTSISAGIRSLQQGQSVLQECWGSAQRWLTSISTTIGLAMLVQRVLQEF